MPDQPGQVATGRDTKYSITIEDAAELYARSGHPRTLRSIQRYCASGHLDSLKMATSLGDKYFIDPTSLDRHVAQIEELSRLDLRPTGRDLSRHVATTSVAEPMYDMPRQAATTDDMSPPVAVPVPLNREQLQSDGPRQGTTPEPAMSPSVVASDTQDAAPTDDMTRPVATEPAPVSPPVVPDNAPAADEVPRLQKELTRKDEEIAFIREQAQDERDFLREQIDRKDRTIDALIERDRETNFLVRGLQEMLTPLLGAPRRKGPEEDAGQHAMQ